MPLLLPAPLLARLWDHVRAELPRECVGLLGGVGEVVQALYPLSNVAELPERDYQAGAGELLRAFKAMDREGFSLAAIYHSHPRGPAVPSAADRALAAYPVPYLIADPLRGELRAYLLPQGQEVPLEVVPELRAGPRP